MRRLILCGMLLVICFALSVNNRVSFVNVLADNDINYLDREYGEDCVIVEVLDLSFDQIIDKLQLDNVSISYSGNSRICEGYISSLNDYVVINGTKVNIQISQNDTVILIGCPLIKKSF